MTVFNINASNHRIIDKVNKYQDKVIWRAPATEMDNNADTHCFGEFFCPISLNYKECTVSPFIPEYTEQMNIPIYTSFTAFKLASGEVVILEFVQGLWF